MGIAHDTAVALRGRIHTAWASAHQLAGDKLGARGVSPLEVRSDAFVQGGRLPKEHTADGAGTPPDLQWTRAPENARSLAIVVEDPDTRTPRPFVHWIVYGIAPAATSLLVGTDGNVREGLNSRLSESYAPPAPPRRHGPHHYHFQVFALDAPLDVPAPAGRSALAHAMAGHVIAFGELIGTYSRD